MVGGPHRFAADALCDAGARRGSRRLFRTSSAAAWRRSARSPATLWATCGSGWGRRRVRWSASRPHADQIGLIVTHVDESGYVFVERIGGVAPLLVPGRHFVIHGRRRGCGRRRWPQAQPHHPHGRAPARRRSCTSSSSTSAPAGGTRRWRGSRSAIRSRSRRTSSSCPPAWWRPQALDDRAGLYAMIRALELYAEAPGAARLIGFATVHEETTFMGAKALALRLRPTC